MKPASLGQAAYLWSWTVFCLLVLFVIPVLPAPIVRAHFWAFDHVRDVPLWGRALAAAAVLAVLVPAVREAAWRGGSALVDLGGKRPWPRGSGYLLAGVASFACFWLLRCRNYALGDSALLVRRLSFEAHTRGYLITLDEPLDLWVHSAAYRALHRAFGGSVEQTYALTSALAGSGFVLVMLALWGRMTADPDRRAVGLGLVLTAGTVQLFFGYLENYTLVAAAAMLYVFLAHRYLSGRGSIFWPGLVLGLALSFHVLAGWLLPSLLYLWWTGRADGEGARRLRRLVSMFVGLVIPVAATLACSAQLGVHIGKAFGATHLAHMKFLFLLDESYRYYQYPFLSARHLNDALNQILLTSLPGVMALGFVGLFGRGSLDLRDRTVRFLGLVTVFLQVFALTWNPDLGAYRDWDLFSLMGLAYALWGGYALVNVLTPRERVRSVGLVLVVLSAVMTGSWVVSNARRAFPVEDRAEAAHVWLGNTEARRGQLEDAIEHYRRALRLNPQNAGAHLSLAEAYRIVGDLEEAARHFEAYLVLAPQGEDAQRARAMLSEIGREP